MESKIQVSPYRWVVLGAFMLITIIIEIQWLTHAPIARAAEEYYRGQFNPESIINIDFLSMIYMLIFLIVCIIYLLLVDFGSGLFSSRQDKEKRR